MSDFNRKEWLLYLLIILSLCVFARSKSHQPIQCECQETLKFDGQTTVVTLDYPHRPFHSHHWFHIGEYYLSQTESLLTKTIGQHVIILPTQDRSFNLMLSPTSFFLFLLAFDVENVQSLVIADPASVTNCNAIASQPVSIDMSQDEVYSYWVWDIGYPISRKFGRVVGSSRKHLPHFQPGNGSKYSCFHSQEHEHSAFKIGSSPVVASNWFQNENSTSIVRRRIDRLCTARKAEIDVLMNESIINPQLSSLPRRKMVIYIRDNNRKFFNFDEALNALAIFADGNYEGDSVKEFLQNWKEYSKNEQPNSKNILIFHGKLWSIWIVKHIESINPCVLSEALRDADMLLTVHGFQCMAMLYMPVNALLVEIFPYRYYKPTYRLLAASYGIQYVGLHSSYPVSFSREFLRPIPKEYCMANNRCRSFARGDDVDISPHIDKILALMEKLAVL